MYSTNRQQIFSEERSVITDISFNDVLQREKDVCIAIFTKERYNVPFYMTIKDIIKKKCISYEAKLKTSDVVLVVDSYKRLVDTILPGLCILCVSVNLKKKNKNYIYSPSRIMQS